VVVVVSLGAVKDVSVRLAEVVLLVPLVLARVLLVSLVVVVVVATPRQMYCSSGEVKLGSGASSLNITNSESMLYKHP
jgi:hypothetical protein